MFFSNVRFENPQNSLVFFISQVANQLNIQDGEIQIAKRPWRAKTKHVSLPSLSNAMSDQFKAINPGMTFGQLAKYTSVMYTEMPPAEKESWVARAEADKERYLH